MLAFADVVDLFADELAGLGAGCFSLTRVAVGAFDGLFFWHLCSSRDVRVGGSDDFDHNPDGKVSAGSPAIHPAVRSSGSTALVTSKWST